jgi:hypothetical protein
LARNDLWRKTREGGARALKSQGNLELKSVPRNPKQKKTRKNLGSLQLNSSHRYSSVIFGRSAQVVRYFHPGQSDAIRYFRLSPSTCLPYNSTGMYISYDLQHIPKYVLRIYSPRYLFHDMVFNPLSLSISLSLGLPSTERLQVLDHIRCLEFMVVLPRVIVIPPSPGRAILIETSGIWNRVAMTAPMKVNCVSERGLISGFII